MADRPVGAKSAELRNVLVVDDLPDWAPFFTAVFRRVHHLDVRVTAEVSGRRAIDILGQRPFDLVVSDFRLRDAHGIDVLAAARETCPGAYRVLMSSYEEIPLPIARIRRAEVDAYLRKPFAHGEALETLLPFLDRAEGGIAAARQEAREMEAVAAAQEASMGRAPRA